MKTVYWDACVFHALFGKEPGREEVCVRIEKSARDGVVQIYTSTATFVECVWIKGQPDKLSKEHEAVIQRYFMHKFIRAISCDRQIAESARNLIWQFPHLKPKDAIHVASAISQQIGELHSYDDDLLKLDGKINGLKICEPHFEETPEPPQTATLI
jgi:predicted nucleic acid-binding protein